jgi:hypothetical protein
MAGAFQPNVFQNDAFQVDPPVIGVLSVTLADATLVSIGTLAITGTLGVTLDDATLAATGQVSIIGVLGITLADVAIAATGILAITGVLGITLQNAMLFATGIVQQPPFVPQLGGGVLGGQLVRIEEDEDEIILMMAHLTVV